MILCNEQNNRRIADEYCGDAAVTKFPTKYVCVEHGLKCGVWYDEARRAEVWGSEGQKRRWVSGERKGRRGPGRSPGDQHIFKHFDVLRTALLLLLNYSR